MTIVEGGNINITCDNSKGDKHNTYMTTITVTYNNSDG